MSAHLAEARGIAQNVEQEAEAECDRVFGAHMRQAIEDAHDAATARAVMVAFCQPTKPGTAARKVQDRVHGVLTARLEKIVSEVRS